ncbi:MAG: hypothetical protein DYG89_36440 [Caldilinea sp. CFX5]|nr:hypothetical protein [Caldilinea sp. CFX5]
MKFVLSALLLLFGALLGGCMAPPVVAASVSSLSTEPLCQQVKGRYQEQIVDAECDSPVGLCFAGEYTSGAIRGTAFVKGNTLAPTADTPTTSVVLFSSTTTVQARMGGKQGELLLKNAGAFQSTGAGTIVDVQFITGGAGDFSGASGVIHASGRLDPLTGYGESAYEGTLCLP